MIKLEDIIVWKLKSGETIISSANEPKRIATVVGSKVDWLCKEECSEKVIYYVYDKCVETYKR